MAEDYENSLAYGLLKKFEAYRHEVEQYAAIAQACPIPVFVTAHDGNTLLYTNPVFTNLTGIKATDIDKNWLQAVYPADLDIASKAWSDFIKTRQNTGAAFRIQNISTAQVSEVYAIIHAIENNGFVGFFIHHECKCWINELIKHLYLEPAPVSSLKED